MPIIYQLGPVEFDEWRGPPPPLVGDQLTESKRPGVDGAAHALAGRWEQAFEVDLVKYVPTYPEGLALESSIRDLRGVACTLIYNSQNFTTLFQHRYRPLHCYAVSIKKIQLFNGLNGFMVQPTEVVTRWKLAPIRLEQ